MEENKKEVKDLVATEDLQPILSVLKPEDAQKILELKDELTDTWTKKQVFRTETEMRFSVLNDLKYPTKASKYWQCVREQNVYLENLMTLSFEYRKNEIEIKKLNKKIDEEEDELEKELLKIEIDEKTFAKANMQLTAKDRMREIKLWSNLKKETDDGSFDKQDVNVHQLESYHKIMQNRAKKIHWINEDPVNKNYSEGQSKEAFKKVRNNLFNLIKKFYVMHF